jgi:hypothetical protein
MIGKAKAMTREGENKRKRHAKPIAAFFPQQYNQMCFFFFLWVWVCVCKGGITGEIVRRE